MPTLIEIGGGQAPPRLDGRSFAGVLLGRTTAHRDRIFTTHTSDPPMNVYPMRSVRTADWKYLRNLQPTRTFTTHIDRGKPVDGAGYFASWRDKAATDPDAAAVVARYHQRPAEELYDLGPDPEELQNLASDPRHAHRLRTLRAALDAWMAANGDQGHVPGEP